MLLGLKRPDTLASFSLAEPGHALARGFPFLTIATAHTIQTLQATTSGARQWMRRVLRWIMQPNHVEG
jgi:hypothetical protein